MKRLLLALLFCTNSLAMDIQPSHTGAWFNPDQSGHGLSVQVLDEGQLVVFWYTYDHDGEPMWLIGQGEAVGSRAVLDTFYHNGMRFGEWRIEDRTERLWGTMTLDFHDCDTMTFSYQSGTHGSGTIPMLRLSDADNLKCSNNLMTGAYKVSLESDPDFPEYGIGFATLLPTGKVVGYLQSQFNQVVFSGDYNREADGNMTLTAAGFDYEGGVTPAESARGGGGPGSFGVEDSYGAFLQGSRTSEGTYRHQLYSRLASLGYRNLYYYDIRNEEEGVLTISGNKVSGSFYGCDITGTWSHFGEKFDLAELSLDFSGCSRSGHFKGAAFLNQVVLENGWEGVVWAMYGVN